MSELDSAQSYEADDAETFKRQAALGDDEVPAKREPAKPDEARKQVQDPSEIPADIPTDAAGLHQIAMGFLRLHPFYTFFEHVACSQMQQRATRETRIANFRASNRVLHWLCIAFDLLIMVAASVFIFILLYKTALKVLSG